MAEENEEEKSEKPKFKSTRTELYNVYASEGLKLRWNNNFHKAVERYTLALDVKPGDEICLVARSNCYTRLGDYKNALKDAESAMKFHMNSYKAIFQKAQVLFDMGEFEEALVLFHRGRRLRPDMNMYRLGIQKAEESIRKSMANFDLRDKTMTKHLRNALRALQAKAAEEEAIHAIEEGKEKTKTTFTSEMSGKWLLGKNARDQIYLKRLVQKADFHPPWETAQSKRIVHNAQETLDFLGQRREFWAQQSNPRRRAKSASPECRRIYLAGCSP